MNVIVYALSALAALAFTFILRMQNLTYLYIAAGVFGYVYRSNKKIKNIPIFGVMYIFAASSSLDICRQHSNSQPS